MKQCQMKELKGISNSQLTDQDLLASCSQLLEYKVSTVTIWNPETFEIQTFYGQIWNGRALAMDIVQTIRNWTFLSGFQMVFGKMVPICPEFRISDPIWNPDHLQPNLFWTIQNPD